MAWLPGKNQNGHLIKIFIQVLASSSSTRKHNKFIKIITQPAEQSIQDAAFEAVVQVYIFLLTAAWKSIENSAAK